METRNLQNTVKGYQMSEKYKNKTDYINQW